MDIALFLAVWYGAALALSPFVYARFMAQHFKRFPYLHAAGEGVGYAFTQTAVGTLSMGPFALPLSIWFTSGAGWRWQR